MDDILDLDALDQARLVHDRQVSAVEIMQATLARVARDNPAVNAIVSPREPEAALAEARAIDAALRAAAPRSPLDGLPVAIKDMADAAGLPTSMGSPILAGRIAQSDDLPVARMRAAGLIVIGKTNTPEFGLGSHTFNPVFGATRNPWDLRRSAGGSSGGAAVALATRMLAVADGSDMMGSLRNPAAWNNVYGMRPSWGRVPTRPEGDTFLHPLATVGPMARSPRDLAALLDIQSGPEQRRPFNLPKAPMLERIEAGVGGRRIGWLGDWGGAYATEEGILTLCEAALEAFGVTGVRVEPLAPPFAAADLWRAWLDLRAFANADRLGPLWADPARRARLKATAIWEVETGLALTPEAIRAASLIRSRWYARAAELFETFDALALPSAQVWPFPIEQEYPRRIGGRAMDSYHRWMEVVVPASLIGLPALAVPAGFGAQGLPMGVQLIGRHGDDLGLLQLAEAWHQALPFARRAPPPVAGA